MLLCYQNFGLNSSLSFTVKRTNCFFYSSVGSELNKIGKMFPCERNLKYVQQSHHLFAMVLKCHEMSIFISLVNISWWRKNCRKLHSLAVCPQWRKNESSFVPPNFLPLLVRFRPLWRRAVLQSGRPLRRHSGRARRRSLHKIFLPPG